MKNNNQTKINISNLDETIEGLAVQEVGIKKNNEDDLVIIDSIPLVRISVINNRVKNYNDDWSKKQEIIGVIDSSTNLKSYDIIQYLSRITSGVAGVLLLTNLVDSRLGGIITTFSSTIDFLVFLSKNLIFKVEEKSKKLSEFRKSTSDVFSYHKELSEF